MKLELFYFPQCPFCQIVISKIDLLGVTSQVELLNINKDNNVRQRLIKDTGTQTVPCLYVDDIPMFESTDINRWFDKHFKQGK